MSRYFGDKSRPENSSPLPELCSGPLFLGLGLVFLGASATQAER